MFKVEVDKITITKGDTAALTIRASNKTFASADRAIFTIANRAGTDILYSQEYELSNGQFTVQFTNAMTDDWAPGQYKWQVRYIVSPTRSDGQIDGGSEVITPWEPKDFVVQSVLADF